MDDGKKYVVYGMRLKCDQGTMENYLSTDTGHGIIYQGQPVMNANDHEKGIHLTHFGDCNSKKVFEEAKKEADEKYKAEEGDGFFAMAGKWLAKNVIKATLDFKAAFTSNKCELVTPLPWLFCSEDHTLDGAPALVMESLCPCALGGVISIVPVVEEVPEEEEVVDEEKQNKEEFLNQIPAKLQAIINISTLKATDDGFVMCTESLANMMNNLGITDINISKGRKEGVQGYYDDWYLYGVKDSNGNFTFSLLKMREQENDQYDGNAPGIAVPFIDFDVQTLAEVTSDNTGSLEDSIDRTIKDEGIDFDQNLQEYFAKTESKAPYLIADHYVDMIAQQSVDGKIALDEKFNTVSTRVLHAAYNLNERAGSMIIDRFNNCIHIEDKNNLSEVEKRAILLMHTGNETFNSFAAEVESHSDDLVSGLAKLPDLREKAIRADMAIMPKTEEENILRSLHDPYYHLNSSIVKEQERIHGKR